MTKAMILALGLLCTSGAQASQCYSVRDFDQRLACLAQEQGSPEGCLSIHDWDQREACRRQAKQEQRLRELERGR